jgi:hypothetical protein
MTKAEPATQTIVDAISALLLPKKQTIVRSLQ